MLRSALAPLALVLVFAACENGTEPPRPRIPDKTVVLTFDDACRSHLEFVAPLLKEHGFGATFFPTALWMENEKDYLSWDEVAALDEMGFEVGNHTWGHVNYSVPYATDQLRASLKRVEGALESAGVPKPISFAWPGDCFGPESLAVLRDTGYRFARRGPMPELSATRDANGPLYDPTRCDPCLIPTSALAHAWWTQEFFEEAAARARDDMAVVFQFHGIPDPANENLSTTRSAFRGFIDHLKRDGYTVIALRDLIRFVDPEIPVRDPLIRARWPE